MSTQSQSRSRRRSQSPKIGMPPKLAAFGEALKRLCAPWKLPPGTRPTHEMDEEDIVYEAQDRRPLLRELGLRDSGLMHPNEVNLAYLRTCHYLGKVPAKPYIWQFAVSIGIALLMGTMFYFGPTQEGLAFEDADTDSGSENADQNAVPIQWEKPLYVVIGISTGLLFGSGAGYSIRTMIQFWTVHAPARIAYKKLGDNGVMSTVAVLEMPLPRLAFANRHHERIFSGIESESGFSNGKMNLETNVDIAFIGDPREMYLPGVLRPCVSNFTGVNSSRRHALNDQAKEAGRLNSLKMQQREKEDGLGNWIGEHKGLTFFIVAACVSVFLLAIGVEIDFNEAKQIGEVFGGG